MNDDTAIIAPASVTQSAVLTAAKLKPGDIIWIDLPPTHAVGQEQEKTRPWVIISSARFNQTSSRGLVQAVPLSLQFGLLQLQLPWRSAVLSNQLTYLDKGWPKQMEREDRVALCEQTRALSEKRFLSKPATTTSRVVDELRACVSHILELY